MKKMNIAMIGQKKIPSREGGVEIVVQELATRMVALGHSVTCYNRRGHHVSGKEFDQKELKEYRVVSLRSVFTIETKGLAAMSSSFFGAVKAAFGKYDVVHFHAEGPCFMLWIPKLFGKRCIATIHGLDHQRAKWGGFAQWYIKQGEKCAAKYANQIIVLSENVREYFMKQYGRETVFITNGVNKPERKKVDLIKKKYNLDLDSYILFLARLVPEKGLDYLIQAFKQIDTDLKLVIAGGASDTKEYEMTLHEMAKEDSRIVFTGFVQGTELEELYSNAYLYVLPSDLEGMPLSLLEAMSYGNCCVVSSIQECTSVVEDCGVVFLKSNTQDLKKKLEYLIENPDMVQRIKDMSSEFICNKYNWDSVVEKTLNLYCEKK